MSGLSRFQTSHYYRKRLIRDGRSVRDNVIQVLLHIGPILSVDLAVI